MRVCCRRCSRRSGAVPLQPPVPARAGGVRGHVPNSASSASLEMPNPVAASLCGGGAPRGLQGDSDLAD